MVILDSDVFFFGKRMFDSATEMKRYYPQIL